MYMYPLDVIVCKEIKVCFSATASGSEQESSERCANRPTGCSELHFPFVEIVLNTVED